MTASLQILGPIDRSSEAKVVGQVPASWDTVFKTDTGIFDWALADPAIEPHNAGGLRAIDPYATAILIQLGTHKYRGEGIPGEAGDLRGWWGDRFADEAAGEGPIGSWLWTLKRSAINDDILKLAEYFVQECLQTLINQGAATNVSCIADADRGKGWLLLSVQVYIPGRELPFDLVLPPYPLWT